MNNKQYFIVTRFNLAVNFRPNSKKFKQSDKPWLDTQYLEHRFDIFEKYTFSSLMSQTDKNFKWLVMFHCDTPEVFKERIRILQNKMPQFYPLFFTDKECELMDDTLERYILQFAKKEKGIISTRLDNDDIVHSTFVEKVKKYFQKIEKDAVLTYPCGAQYDNGTKQINLFNYTSNHFLSLYAKEGGLTHALQFEHSNMKVRMQEENIDVYIEKSKIPMWVELVTGSNAVNSIKWKFYSLMVPYQIKKEYPLLELKWKTRFGWISGVLTGVVKVIYNKGRNFLKDFIL